MIEITSVPRNQRGQRLLRFGLAVSPLLVLAACVFALGCGESKLVAPVPTEKITDLTAAKDIQVGGRKLFADWPKENPDLVVVVSGQSFGYLSPCGCSRPQSGGLERRYNVVQSLKAKGWDVVGVDLGDIAPIPGKGLSEQAIKKYAFHMKSLQVMGYVAVGLGKTEFQNPLMQLLGQFTVNNADKRPIVLSANLVGGVERDPMNKANVVKAKTREEYFQVPNSRPMVDDVELVTDKKVSVGIIGMVGPSIAQEIVGVDGSFDFEKNSAAIPAALKKLNGAKTPPELKVLLYQGTQLEAMQVAKDFPEIQIIVCASEGSEAEAPMFPIKVPATNPTTQIIQMGHKGKNIGLLGVFKTDQGLDLRYQLIPLGEEYLTPEKPVDLAKENAVLQLLEQYTGEVKKDDFLSLYSKKIKGRHQAMVKNPKADLKYIGSAACAKCHAAEFKKWSETKHSHAFEALEKLATRPSLRQFDPECVVCHTTGFEYTSGFESKEKTKELLNNGCENCHGPGSGHAAKPNDEALIKELAPWKLNKADKLPDLAFLEKMARIPEADRGKVEVPNKLQRVVRALDGMVCRKCHDLDNDPKFDIWTYLPQIYHSNLQQSGLPDK